MVIMSVNVKHGKAMPIRILQCEADGAWAHHRANAPILLVVVIGHREILMSKHCDAPARKFRGRTGNESDALSCELMGA
jgi:hypothetical protein